MSKSILSRPYLSRIDFFKKISRGKTVLHLGCSSGRFIEDRIKRGDLLHEILNSEAAELFGVDIHEVSVQLLRKLGYKNIFVGNVELLDDLDMNREFDIVIAGDLLEHITRPGAMLDGVKRFINRSGKFIVSTNNAFGIHYQIKRWLGVYKEHHEHVCFYSPETLRNLFERHGYTILEMYGAFTTPPHSARQKLIFALASPIFRFLPVLAGTLIVVATPANTVEPDMLAGSD